MGFMKAMKAANNAWAMVSCEEGCGYLGPENLIDNRGHRLVIAIGVKVFTFVKSDVKSIDLICATSEWIKYAILLKNGKRYIATFMATTLSNKGKQISNALLNFEWWMAGIIYKEKSVQTYAPTVSPVTSTRASVSVEAESVKTTAKVRGTSSTAQTPPQSAIPAEKGGSEVQGMTSADAENTYLFALQMINTRSYNIAYNALLKIKGYKNSEELLKQIEDKI